MKNFRQKLHAMMKKVKSYEVSNFFVWKRYIFANPVTFNNCIVQWNLPYLDLYYLDTSIVQTAQISLVYW